MNWLSDWSDIRLLCKVGYRICGPGARPDTEFDIRPDTGYPLNANNLNGTGVQHTARQILGYCICLLFRHTNLFSLYRLQDVASLDHSTNSTVHGTNLFSLSYKM